MTRFSIALALAGAVALAPIAQGQGRAGTPQGGIGRAGGPPGPGGMRGGSRGGPGVDAASMLLARTGELKLTDAQVGRLAAVARRASERRASLRSTGDSLRTAAIRARATDTTRRAGLREPAPAVRSMMERAQEGAHADLRDALAVLTPDQQATAFEMMARAGNRGGAGMREGRGMRRGGGMREGRRPGKDAQRGRRGMNSERPQGPPPVNGVAPQGRRPAASGGLRSPEGADMQR